MNYLVMRRGMKLACAVAAASALVFSMSACGNASSSDKVALLVSTLNNPFFVDLRDGAQAEAKKLGVDLQVSDAQNDSSKPVSYTHLTLPTTERV